MQTQLRFLFAMTLFTLSVVSTDVFAHGEGEVSVQPMLSEVPSDLSGKRISMVEVTYPPGVSFIPHRHPGTVLVYVLAGEIQSQLDSDEAPVTYKAGDSWYEKPGARHVYSNNPSATETAKLLAILVGDDGAELVLPDQE